MYSYVLCDPYTIVIYDVTNYQHVNDNNDGGTKMMHDDMLLRLLTLIIFFFIRWLVGNFSSFVLRMGL